MNKDQKIVVFLIATFVLLNLMFVSSVQASVQASAPSLASSNSSMNYTENAISIVDPGITVTGESNIPSAKVFIGDGYVSGEDRLVYTTTNGITGSFDSATAILTLSGSCSPSDYQAALRTVKYENTKEAPNTAPRNITFVIGDNAVYNPDTEHYYEAVNYGSSISWTTAKAEAESKSLYGLQGYLVTITSSDENTFVGSKTSADAWIGANDSSSEGDWRWVTGPEGTEESGAGRKFYSGKASTGGAAVDGEYNNWASGEPNDANGEDYAHMYGRNVQKNWNDYPNSLDVTYYLVEYGGMNGDPTLTLSATVSVNVASVNDAPTTPGVFTTPTSNQIINGSSTITAAWGFSSDLEGNSVKYDLWFFNGTWTQIGNLLNSNSMSYSLPSDNTESATLRVYANDTMDNSSARDVTFTIDSTAPVYNWIEKALNASTGENVTVQINVTDVAGIDWCNITVDGQEYQMSNSTGNYSWNISVPASDSGQLVSSMTYNCSFGDIFGYTNATENVVVNVSILPIANLSVDQSRGISPLEVNFTDNSSGLVENWTWDFGDGNSSTEQNPTNLFTRGNYTVNLTVTNTNGTSSTYFIIKCENEPTYTKSPTDLEVTSSYGEEHNFTISSTLYSSYEWFIDGSLASATGVTLSNNTNDSAQLSYCLINSSQYIDQSDFFVGTFNISLQATNDSIGRTDTHFWLWTVTNSSSNGDDIEIVTNTTPQIIGNGSEKHLFFNTTTDEDLDSNGLACSIISTSFNTSNNSAGIQIKVETLNASSINVSSIDFSTTSIYQYLDISFNNETLVNNGSNNRSIEFRVLNSKDGGTLIINTVYLRHWANPQWDAYTPELTGNDGTYSYFIVRNVSGFSPYAVTCDYQSSSASTSQSSSGMSAYLKMKLFWSDEEEVIEELIEILEDNEIDSVTDNEEVVEPLADQDLQKSDVSYIKETSDKSNKLQAAGIIFVTGLLLFIFWKKKNDGDE
ncbi:PGF-pre-PGF domain-containing protein [Methanococcoides sp. SA1]|nr:PGF-pre-PGF domain-containing protein [Methanococcoides sp. SA1]